MNDEPQTFVHYNWGSYQNHRETLWTHLQVRDLARPKIRTYLDSYFKIGEIMFPQGPWPGSYLLLVSR